MKKNTKNILVAIVVGVMIILLGLAAYFIALRMQTEETVAPTAPESKPSAAVSEWVGGEDCNTGFTIAAITGTPTDEPTATPTDEPTATPTDEPTATPTDEPTATPTDEPTATPTDEPTATATPTTVVEATPTATAAASLPDAGVLSLSGVLAFGGGLLMAILGIILAL